MKSQTIRVIDVLFLGPLMIRSGWLQRKNLTGQSMMIFGFATILYNLKNYQEIARIEKSLKQ